MALFNDLKKKVVDTTQGAVRGAKDFADVTRQNSLINDERKQITDLLIQIGEYVYKANSEVSDPTLRNLCDAIAAANERIAKHQLEIQQIKGVKSCPNCGRDVSLTQSFCNNCGSALKSDSTPTLEEIAQPETKTCANCGEALEAATIFCPQCGQKVS